MPLLRALESALARSRCCCMRRRKPSSSTLRPCSAAISRVRSIGNPYVSWRAKASLARQLACRRRCGPPATAVSKIVVPVLRVCRNAASSPTAIWRIRLTSSFSSGYCGAMVSTERVDELAHRGLLRAEQPHHADRAAHDAAQDVAAALVAGDDAVADEEHAGAGVVGHDAQRDVVALVDAVARAGELDRAIEDAAGGVDLVDVVDALQQGRHALEAHAGVDVLRGQGLPDVEVLLGPHRRQLVLHEDEVPDLEVAVLVDDGPALAPVLGAAVVVDLRARAARAGHAHRPVVVLRPAALDALVGQPASRCQISMASSSSSYTVAQSRSSGNP